MSSKENTDQINKKLEQIEQIVNLPPKYKKYNKDLLTQFFHIWKITSNAKLKGIDPNITPESQITIDLADRAEYWALDLPIAERLRELLTKHKQEIAALKIAEEIALGKFGFMELEQSLEKAIRVGLAVVTEGVTVASLQGLYSVEIRENRDLTKYAALFYAGPMRSAGGTESALSVVIADHVRKILGLSTYQADCYGDDETGRILEELRIYERRASSFQYRVPDEAVIETIKRLPVEINGIETDDIEVVTHRIKGEKQERIKTNKLRGGALRVLNDGIIGRNKKLSKLLKDLNISGWEWLDNLDTTIKDEKTDKKSKSSHFEDVISGRPVLSTPGVHGGLRLRYGRSFNTGHATVGIHPATSAILGFPVVVGTQIKTNIPGKASTIAFVDTIDGPTIRLKNGDVKTITTLIEAKELLDQTDSILYMGDILISYGDFLENNTTLPPSGYVEEIWIEDLRIKTTNQPNLLTNEITKILNKELIPDFNTACKLSLELNVPLHPKFLYFWDFLDGGDILFLRQKLTDLGKTLTAKNEERTKTILEKAGIPHHLTNNEINITEDTAKSVAFTLNLKKIHKISGSWSNTCELLSSLCNIQIMKKNSISIGVRVGRPEKAMLRKMRPAVQSIFPIGKNGGIRSDILVASNVRAVDLSSNIRTNGLVSNDQTDGFITIDIISSFCTSCDKYCSSYYCPQCKNETRIKYKCPRCYTDMEKATCTKCKISTKPHAKNRYNLKKELIQTMNQTKYHPKPPLKGVEGLFSEIKYPEPLSKGFLRNKHDLSVYRDGTIRFDLTNAPLTHATSKMINTDIETLKKLGYQYDINGKELVTENQIFELFIQDIIISHNSAKDLLKITNFIDDLLKYTYEKEQYYKITTPEEIVGHLVLGLAPHTSVGIVGRVIGFTTSQVCFAHPYWHSSKRRDCDGDGDSIILLMDALLNFSKEYLPSKIGGLMDAPLLIQPVVIPKELQRQARNLDIMSSYPREFYNQTEKHAIPNTLNIGMKTTNEFMLSNSEKQFIDFHFTHGTSNISLGPERSSYTKIKDIREKIKTQLDIAQKINAVDANEVVKALIKTHLIPDIIGNTRAYLTQTFRCRNISCTTKKIRRMPITGKCPKCQSELKTTVTKKSALKYLPITVKLANDYDVGDYIKNRINLLVEETDYLFPSNKDKNQTELTTFI